MSFSKVLLTFSSWFSKIPLVMIANIIYKVQYLVLVLMTTDQLPQDVFLWSSPGLLLSDSRSHLTFWESKWWNKHNRGRTKHTNTDMVRLHSFHNANYTWMTNRHIISGGQSKKDLHSTEVSLYKITTDWWQISL